MSRILVTGSTDGLGRSTAESLLDDGHEVILHARNAKRREAVVDLLDRGAQCVVGDFARLDEVNDVADQALALGPIDVVVHNCGVWEGADVLNVNVLAPYILTARITPVRRLIYLSSGLHKQGVADLLRVDWSGARPMSYNDSKLFVTTLMAAVARRWSGVLSHAVDPGWMPTRMGGPKATGDITLGHVTQAWLATTNNPETLVSGRYWHYQQLREPHPAVHDVGFQEDLLRLLSEVTGVKLS
ncbi:SDR family NAD(P)-dependent oxidoreductase [Leucobacter denitrificans]|uniref:SDR family NAD(P)-dependent oxidoreductase n=1 Tax=Leucobacter denitrificans TaxID=683042 RepID=A0A7G9S6B0_9MICO|nr:SDR family NAD(P)-dependent oxidoreductase [Leucobacter denitrificans]QNN63385.1 SDR family NAD(P)-dependent oxidoreductase [Leucobacter denitrificans]